MPPEVRLRFPNFLIMIIFTFFIDPFNYPDKTANSSRNSNGDPDQIFRYVHFNLSRRDANFGRACLLSLKTVTEVQWHQLSFIGITRSPCVVLTVGIDGRGMHITQNVI